jgi:hypothetical protein
LLSLLLPLGAANSESTEYSTFSLVSFFFPAGVSKGKTILLKIVKKYDLNSKEHRMSEIIHGAFGIYFLFPKICLSSSNKFLKHLLDHFKEVQQKDWEAYIFL